MNQHSFRNRIALTAAILGAALGATALDLPTRTVNGNVCYYYEVQPKETVYNLARRFGLTKAQIIQYNPSVADGLRAGQTLYFPKNEVDNLPESSKDTPTSHGAPVVMQSSPSSHLVKKGETIYGISRQYNISEADLIAANPRLESTGLKYGSVLTIPTKKNSEGAVDHSDATPDMAPAVSDYRTPVATAYETPTLPTTPESNEVPTPSGITSSEVYIENSTIDNTTIPATAATTPQVEDSTILAPLETQVLATDAKQDTVRLTVMLPFMLSTQHPDKQAQLYTEFYRGLLMAADSLRSHGRPLIISAYDTTADIDSVNSILSDPNVRRSDVIIAPDDDLQLGRIASVASDNGIKVFNIFAVKSTLYHNNGSMMQANIPHSAMYDTAVDGLLKEYPGYVPVLLVPQENGKTDKIEFQARLRAKADAEGRNVVEIPYHGVLKQSDLATLVPGTNYIFIPSSGTQTEFSRIIGAVKAYKEGLEDYNGGRLFGYPEWITFRGDALDNMRFMNTTIYSRFYNDDSSLRSKDFMAEYIRWFGGPTMNAIPVQGILGFDTGMYLIRALNDNDAFPSSASYSGIQSDYRFEKDGSNAGLVNKALYLVNFRPSGITEKISL